MALPVTGTLGQIVSSDGYDYQWTGVGWHIIGQSLLVVSGTNILSDGNLNIGGTTTNTTVRADGISVINSISNVSITAASIFVGNSSSNLKLNANLFSVGNTLVSANGVLIYTPSPIPVPGVATAVNTNLNSNGLIVANNIGTTTIGAGLIVVSPNTVISQDSIFIGNNSSNVFINASAIYITNGINQSTGQVKQTFMNATFYSGTANNVLYVNGLNPSNFITNTGNFTLSGNLNFTASNTFFTSNVNFFGGDKIYFDSQLNENYFTGTSYNALNSQALGNYSVDVFQLKQDLATDVALLKSACSAFSDDSAKLGGVLAANYVNTSGSYTISGIHTHTNNVEIRNAKLVINTSSSIWANGSVGLNGYLLVSNGSTVYWASPGQVVDVTVPYVWQNTHSFRGNGLLSNTVFGNTTVFANIASNTSGVFFTGTSFDSQKLGGALASNYALKTYADSISLASSGTGYSNAMNDTLTRSGTYTGNNYFNAANTTFAGSGYLTIGARNLDAVYPSATATYANSTYFTVANFSSGATGGSTLKTEITTTSIAITNTKYNFVQGGTYYTNNYTTVVNTSVISISNTSTVYSGNPAVGVTTNKTATLNTTAFSLSNSSGYSTNINPNQVIVGNSSLYTNVIGGTIKFHTTTTDSSINATSYTGEANSAVYFGGATSAAYVNTTGNFSLSGNISFGANTSIKNIIANGEIGLGGQVLTAGPNGSNVFWQVIGGDGGIGSVTRIESGNGLTGGPIVGFGTLSVVANTGLVANATGLFVNNNYLSSLYAPLAGAAFTGAVSIANSLTITGNVSISGNLTLTGNSFIIGANNLVVNDAIISLHTPSSLAPLTGNDGRLIGTSYHYYDTEDKHAMLVMNQTNTFLTYYNTADDALSSNPQGISLGTIQAGHLFVGNSTMTGADVRVGNTTVYVTVNSSYFTGTANNSDRLGGLAATNYVTSSVLTHYVADNADATLTSHYTFNSTSGGLKLNTQIYANNALPIAAGQVLTAGGTGLTSNVYWSTIADLVGGAISSISNSDYTIVTTDSIHGIGPITSTGTLRVKVGNGLTATSSGIVVVNTDPSIYVQSSGISINTAWLSNQTANNAYYLVGVDGNKFVQNTDSRTLSGNLVFSANTTKFNSNVYFNNYVSTNTVPETNNAQLLGNSTHRWLSLYVTGSGTTGSGIRIGNTFLTDDISGTTDALVVNTFITNTANINNAKVNNFTANNAKLINPLLANSGGTGVNTYIIGDILYASATNALSQLSIPTGSGVIANGQIFQIINNLPVWGGIDCGESNWAPL